MANGRHAVEIRPDGTMILAHVPKCGMLYWMQKCVGGYIETLRICHFVVEDTLMIVNEEGRIKGMELNPKASAVVLENIYGPALIMKTGKVKNEDDIVGLTHTEGSMIIKEIDDIANMVKILYKK